VKDRFGKQIALAAVLAATLCVGWAGIVEAKPTKNTITATVNGKRYKWKGRFVSTSYSGVGTITLGAKPARPGSILRVIGFGCAIYPPNETFPLTPQSDFCTANYTETKVGRRPTIKGWLALQGVRVTYESFSDGRIAGTFSAVLDPLEGSGATGPVTIEGTFNTSTTGG